jgi:hypothetical protein
MGSRSKTEKKFAELEKQFRGAEYCYVTGLLAPVSTGSVLLIVLVPFQEPVFDVDISIRQTMTPADSSDELQRKFNDVQSYKFGIVKSGANMTAIRLLPGLYSIEISTRYTVFFESLQIVPFQNNLISLAELHERGSSKTLFSTPPPEGFVGPTP